MSRACVNLIDAIVDECINIFDLATQRIYDRYGSFNYFDFDTLTDTRQEGLDILRLRKTFS